MRLLVRCDKELARRTVQQPRRRTDRREQCADDLLQNPYRIECLFANGWGQGNPNPSNRSYAKSAYDQVRNARDPDRSFSDLDGND